MIFYYLPLSEQLKHLNYRKKIEDFAETYFRGSTESKLSAESYFQENGQNPRNPRELIHAKIYLPKVVTINNFIDNINIKFSWIISTYVHFHFPLHGFCETSYHLVLNKLFLRAQPQFSDWKLGA